MVNVKICSIQEVTHVFAAAEAGADFVGLNFVPGVRRELAEEKAYEIVQEFRMRWGKQGPKLIGIFVDQPLGEVNRILERCDLDMAQLSGEESIAYCRGVGRPTVKAIHVPVGLPVETGIEILAASITELQYTGVIPLLDPHVPGHFGGAGVAFDWDVAQELANRHDFVLAGGLNQNNVGAAIRQVRPWGVDVSSGVETNGQKDPEKIRAFVRAARECDSK